MNAVGREIFYNILGSMEKRLYQFTFNNQKEISALNIIDLYNSNMRIYLTSIRLNKALSAKLTPSDEDSLLEYLYKLTKLKGTIVEMFMPISSINESNDSKCFVTPHTVILCSNLVNVKSGDKNLLLKITSGLDNLIGVCSATPQSYNVMLIPGIKEILYKKEDMLEYLI